MKHLTPLAALLLAVCAVAAQGREGPRLRPTANPSAVIAAEIGFAQLAQEKGQWTAFRETATKDAVMFTPQPVSAQSFLKGRANPPVAVRWQAHKVWSSCDGSFAVTYGAWQRPTGTGYFTTVWQRQKDGRYKWVMDQGDDLAQPLAAPEMIAASVADCPRDIGYAVATASSNPATKVIEGRAQDGSLHWSAVIQPDGSRTFLVAFLKDGALRDVLKLNFAAPKP